MASYRGPQHTRLPDDANFVAAYRMVPDECEPDLMTCVQELRVGERIPSIPLPLLGGPEVMLDLESAYTHGLNGLNL